VAKQEEDLVMVAQEQTRPARRYVDTLERWQAALARATSNGLEVFTAADSGERFVTSASKLDTLHRTDGRRCSCEAAVAGDPVCQHRAVVRFVMGWLPAADVEPESSACFWCRGFGRQEDMNNQRFVTCPDCGGTGCRPMSPAIPLHGEPGIEPVAA
jgi:hypothetical protein